MGGPNPAHHDGVGGGDPVARVEDLLERFMGNDRHRLDGCAECLRVLVGGFEQSLGPGVDPINMLRTLPEWRLIGNLDDVDGVDDAVVVFASVHTSEISGPSVREFLQRIEWNPIEPLIAPYCDMQTKEKTLDCFHLLDY